MDFTWLEVFVQYLFTVFVLVLIKDLDATTTELNVICWTFWSKVLPHTFELSKIKV